MDQEKIGRFIAECRKKNNLTQMQLAERLNITDRAVSKWERGRSLPDSSIMLDLCRELRISVNDLLNGEVIKMENYNEKTEKQLLELLKQKEEADRRLLGFETVIGGLSVVILFAMVFIASFIQMEAWLRIVLIVCGIIPFLIGICYALKIEQVAGYYECAKCHHKYIPTYKSVFLSAHAGRTRYMRCPECNQKSWQKKTISKN